MPKTQPARIAAERLKSFIERVEKLDEERKAISGDIRDVYSEAKGGGFDVKIMRKLIGLRKMDAADRDESEALLTIYAHALGMSTSAPVSYVSIAEPITDELTDRRAVRAIEMLGNLASIRDVVKATGMGHGSVQRLRQTLINQGVPWGVPPDHGTLEHDPATGEITERTAAHKPGAAPEGRLAGEEPAVPAPIPEPPAGAAPYATDCDPVAAAVSPRAVPAGDTHRQGAPPGGTPAIACKASRRESVNPGPRNASTGMGGEPEPIKPDDGDEGIDAGWEKADSAATFFVGHAVAGGKEPHPSVPDTAKTVAVIASLADDPGPLPQFLRAGSDARAAITGRR